MKQCSSCKLEKEFTEFYPDKRTSTGCYSACKACTQAKKYRSYNKEKYKEHQRKWRLKNRELTNKYHREWRARRMKTNPKFCLDENLSSVISMCIRGERGRRWWEKLVGYTIEDLVAHIESQFTDGMSWETYPQWEIDHIRPKTSFKYESADDPQFKECWSLANLRPLMKADNRIKGNKILT